MFVIIGLLLLLGAISAVVVIVKPWTVCESDHNVLVALLAFSYGIAV